jgi:hypothetical protein
MKRRNKMGYMTPFMILNDGISQLKDKKIAIKFAEDIYSAACNIHENKRTISLGNFSNPVIALRPKHADDIRVIYCGQNMFIDVSDCRELDYYAKRNQLELFEEIVDSSIDSLKSIKEEIKRYKKEK